MKQTKEITYYCPIGKHKWTSKEWTDKDPENIEELACNWKDNKCNNK